MEQTELDWSGIRKNTDFLVVFVIFTNTCLYLLETMYKPIYALGGVG